VEKCPSNIALHGYDSGDNVYWYLVPEEGQTAVSLLGRQILGNGPFYYFIQVATLLILLLAIPPALRTFPDFVTFWLAMDFVLGSYRY